MIFDLERKDAKSQSVFEHGKHERNGFFFTNTDFTDYRDCLAYARD